MRANSSLYARTNQETQVFIDRRCFGTLASILCKYKGRGTLVLNFAFVFGVYMLKAVVSSYHFHFELHFQVIVFV